MGTTYVYYENSDQSFWTSDYNNVLLTITSPEHLKASALNVIKIITVILFELQTIFEVFPLIIPPCVGALSTY